MMKRFIILISVVLQNIFFASSVYADFETDTGLLTTGNRAGYYGVGIPGSKSPAESIGLAISIILGFIGVLFLGLMIYSGYTWMMARGNQAEVDKAKKMVESSVIGLIIVLAAYAITYFIGLALTRSTSS